MARKFLYIVASLIVLVIVAAFIFNIWSKEITRIAMVPSAEFVEQEPLADNAYRNADMWFSRPGIGTSDPARWQPAIRIEDEESGDLPQPAPTASADETPSAGAANDDQTAQQSSDDYAVFFVHPTSYLNRASWNAPLDDETSQRYARIYVQGMASPFNRASEIWAPRYRQATFGAFLTDQPEAQQALDAAYQDVKQAYEFFLTSVDKDMPIVLVGHSQGSLHLLRLMREEIAGTPTADRIAAFYPVGWPISVEKDLPALTLPGCATPDQAGCIMSWSSFADPADPGDLLETYSQSVAFDGTPRGNSPILCTNPITGSINGFATADQNLGTLVPDTDLSSGELVPHAVPARCDERGLLLIGDPPEMGNAVLPGNNYHVYDIPLFWQNLQEDVTARIAAWHAGTGA